MIEYSSSHEFQPVIGVCFNCAQNTHNNLLLHDQEKDVNEIIGSLCDTCIENIFDIFQSACRYDILTQDLRNFHQKIVRALDNKNEQEFKEFSWTYKITIKKFIEELFSKIGEKL